MQTIGTIDSILHHKGQTVWSIPPDITVFEAIKLLAEKNIGALPVLEGGKVIGIFSERDYTRKVALAGKNSKSTRVREIISMDVFFVTPDNTVEECMRLMTENRIRHLPVCQGGQLVGFISIGDLVNWTISMQSAALDQMESYLAGR
jgi:CBS domain-containing protein